MTDLFNDTNDLAGHLAHLELLAADESAPSGGVSRRTLEAVKAALADREYLTRIREAAKWARAAQRRYFRERTQTALEESKQLERKLDELLKANG